MSNNFCNKFLANLTFKSVNNEVVIIFDVPMKPIQQYIISTIHN